MSDDSDDEGVLAAASAWAARDDDGGESDSASGDDAPAAEPQSRGGYVKDRSYPTKPQHHHSHQQKYSLHVTKVPFDCTQADIRIAFGQKGCNITSIRLVYDRDQKTGERTFRGVAFLDLADRKSFELGLEFHNKPFLGGKMRVQVRPTRTKGELSEIVKKTEEKVAILIARSKEKKKGEDESKNSKSNTTDGEGGDSNNRRKSKKEKRKKIDRTGRTDAAAGRDDDSKADKPAKKAKDETNSKSSKTDDKGGDSNSRRKSKKAKRKKNDSAGRPDDAVGRDIGPKADKPAKKAKRETDEGKPNDSKRKRDISQTSTKKEAKDSPKIPHKKDNSVKLTKKQRARKAAILHMKGKKGK